MLGQLYVISITPIQPDLTPNSRPRPLSLVTEFLWNHITENQSHMSTGFEESTFPVVILF